MCFKLTCSIPLFDLFPFKQYTVFSKKKKKEGITESHTEGIFPPSSMIPLSKIKGIPDTTATILTSDLLYFVIGPRGPRTSYKKNIINDRKRY